MPEQTTIEPTPVREITIQDVERLIDKFSAERYFHLFAIGLCVFIIMGVAIWLIIDNSNNWKTAISLLAPGGTIFACFSRIFKMWDDTVSMYTNLKNR